MQPLRDENDRGEVQGIENSRDEVAVGGKKSKRSHITMRDLKYIRKMQVN